MTSETSEIAHDQHTHPGAKQYIFIGVVLTVLTAGEILLYYMEDEWAVIGASIAVPLILLLSAAKFILVVLFYMHLKFDSKVFSAVFVFPAILGTLVIGAMVILFQVLHG